MFHPHHLQRATTTTKARKTLRTSASRAEVKTTDLSATITNDQQKQKNTSLVAITELPTFALLPDELMLLICSLLPLNDLLRNVALINRRFHDIVHTALKDQFLITDQSLIRHTIAKDQAYFQRTQTESNTPTNSVFGKSIATFFNRSKQSSPPKPFSNVVILNFAAIALAETWLNFCAAEKSLLQADATADIASIRAIIHQAVVTTYRYALTFSAANIISKTSPEPAKFKLPYELFDFISAIARTKIYLNTQLSELFFTKLFKTLDMITQSYSDNSTQWERNFILSPLINNTNTQATLSNLDNFRENFFLQIAFFTIKCGNNKALEAFLAITNPEKQKLLIALCVLIGTPETLEKFLAKFKAENQSMLDCFYAVSAQYKTPLLVQLINNDITQWKNLFLSNPQQLPPSILTITANLNRYAQLNMVSYLTSNKFTQHPIWQQQFAQYSTAATEQNDEAIITQLNQTQTTQPNTLTSTQNTDKTLDIPVNVSGSVYKH